MTQVTLPVYAVAMQADAITRVQSALGDTPDFLFSRIQHVIARHTAIAVNPKPGDGMFFPQYSTPAALQELALKIYRNGGPAHFDAGKRFGSVAFIAGALMNTSLSTGRSTPEFVGLEGPAGLPTNIVVVFITLEFKVHTMYPTCAIMHFYGDNWP
ncbi:MAG: hypothetical protein ACRYHQ_33050 [Janthinobacterium lividum]